MDGIAFTLVSALPNLRACLRRRNLRRIIAGRGGIRSSIIGTEAHRGTHNHSEQRTLIHIEEIVSLS